MFELDLSAPPVVYDVSRLSTRILNRTPNGIDRLDILLADHFLARRPAWPLLFGVGGPRIAAENIGVQTIKSVRALWNETDAVANERILRLIVETLCARGAVSPRLAFRDDWRDRVRRNAAAASAVMRHGLSRGRDPVRNAPRDAIYINTTHFPIEWARHVEWIARRPDVRPVMFIHDILPVSRPGSFWQGESARHERRLHFLAQRGAAALVTSEVVEEELRRVLRQAGRSALPIFRAAPPVSDAFFETGATIPHLEGTVFFVICGTIEPRKNHQLLARVWGRLVREFGAKAPKLLVIGKRGWSTEPIVAALHAPELRDHIVEVSGVPTPVYRALLGHAGALLSPSFDEGFGLTLAEALTAGVPAIASDIRAHREQAGSHALLCDPENEDAWYEAIVAYSRPRSSERQAAIRRLATYEPVSRTRYLERLDLFLETLESPQRGPP